MDKIVWPAGKKFAFTIVDDTDRSTVANTEPVYNFLLDCGFRTTKTVWPLRARGTPRTGGQCLEDADYREWIVRLKERGVEIALHGAADETSERERVLQGLDLLRDTLGHDPDIHVNHVGQKEALYWGAARVDGSIKHLYRLVTQEERYYGHIEGSQYFWGDVCQRRIKFVRNLMFANIDTARMDPLMPYRDERRAYVNFWFSASDGSGVRRFCELLSEPNQDALMEQSGACIVYTHLGSGFGSLPSEFTRLLRRLARLPGWFVPASTLLNYLGEQRGWPKVQDHLRTYRRMQRCWVRDRLCRRLGAMWPGDRLAKALVEGHAGL